MTWEPVPLDVAEWMGMDDDHLRVRQALERRGAVAGPADDLASRILGALHRIRRVLIG
ncbi:hypothetical protein [Nocardioides lijunqiniae]|uniref:hypothetical protein n=1 Tax=Nocardioides lijunqiniae TaxID=2760832 RepID=UPI0018777F1B|nr:hypothetical protein [Nocardioides lijunqiniae]